MATKRLEELLQRRSIPIRGEVLRRLRLRHGLETYELSKFTGMSEDRLAAVEQGGKKVYADNFRKIATALRLKNWESLVDWDSVSSPEQPSKAIPAVTIGKHNITIFNGSTKSDAGSELSDDLSRSRFTGGSLESTGIKAAIDLADQLAGQQGKVIAIYPDMVNRDLIATIEYGDEAVLRFASSMCDGQIDGRTIRSAKIHIDVSINDYFALWRESNPTPRAEHIPKSQAEHDTEPPTGKSRTHRQIQVRSPNDLQIQPELEESRYRGPTHHHDPNGVYHAKFVKKLYEIVKIDELILMDNLDGDTIIFYRNIQIKVHSSYSEAGFVFTLS